ncbi:cytochrome c-550 PedF [Zavarzinia aquatilis]|nr:cytochrome c-550 PedF [Zavarzinia aquatilis]
MAANRHIMRDILVAAVTAAGVAVAAGAAFGHGDVTPQQVDTTGLEPLGSEWRETNPYTGNARAIEIGSSGYNQNCARCHGLEVKSGGIAPDLRQLEVGPDGDAWFVERMKHGAVRDGKVYMPVFDGVLSQEGLWAIRTYIESKHEE